MTDDAQPEQPKQDAETVQPAAAATPEPDRAAEAGLPPDSGPEERVLIVSEAMLRARPMAFGGLALGVLLGLAGVVYFALIRTEALPIAAWGGVAVILGCLGALGFWKIKTLTRRLEITNKRTVRRIGLFSRDTSEVLHDHVRNIEVRQSLWERIWGVGEIGISSSGQDGIEVVMGRVPKPQEVQRIIDLYRPLG